MEHSYLSPTKGCILPSCSCLISTNISMCTFTLWFLQILIHSFDLFCPHPHIYKKDYTAVCSKKTEMRKRERYMYSWSKQIWKYKNIQSHVSLVPPNSNLSFFLFFFSLSLPPSHTNLVLNQNMYHNMVKNTWFSSVGVSYCAKMGNSLHCGGWSVVLASLTRVICSTPIKCARNRKKAQRETSNYIRFHYFYIFVLWFIIGRKQIILKTAVVVTKARRLGNNGPTHVTEFICHRESRIF